MLQTDPQLCADIVRHVQKLVGTAQPIFSANPTESFIWLPELQRWPDILMELVQGNSAARALEILPVAISCQKLILQLKSAEWEMTSQIDRAARAARRAAKRASASSSAIPSPPPALAHPAPAQPTTPAQAVLPLAAATVVPSPPLPDSTPLVATSSPAEVDHALAATESQTQLSDLSSSLVSPTATEQGGGHGLTTLAPAPVSSSITGQQPSAVSLAIVSSSPPFSPTAVKQGGGHIRFTLEADSIFMQSSPQQSFSPHILPVRPHITSAMPWGSHPDQLILWSQAYVTFDPGG